MKWTVSKLRAASMLAKGVSVTAVAEEINVARETVSRWKQQPDFKEKIDEFVKAAEEKMMSQIV